MPLLNYGVLNLTSHLDNDQQSYSFGYVDNDGESEGISRACAVIEEKDLFSLETRSMIWRIAEIKVERQNEWLIFSRQQSDLSAEALADFLADSKNFLEHLREQHERFNLATDQKQQHG